MAKKSSWSRIYDGIQHKLHPSLSINTVLISFVSVEVIQYEPEYCVWAHTPSQEQILSTLYAIRAASYV